AMKLYRIKTIVGDIYGGEWPVAEFAKHKVTYQLAEKHRSQLYLELIPALNSKRVELLDDRKMIDELRRLERRRGRSGKDTIDHPQYGGSDDQANSVAGAGKLRLSRARGKGALPNGVGVGFATELAQAVGSTLSQRGPFDLEQDEEVPRVRREGARETYRLEFFRR